MEKQIGLGYTLSIVTDFTTTEMHKVCKEWSKRTIGKPDVVFRTPQWLMNNLVCATLVYAPNEMLIGTAGMIRSYEDKKAVFYEAEEGNKIPAYEMCSNIVLHEGMGIGKRIFGERLLIAEQNNWASVVVTKNEAIKKHARWYEMLQVSKSTNGYIQQFGEQIRYCGCANPDPNVPFLGERCDTCPRNGNKESKRIFLRVPGTTPIVLPEIHEKKKLVNL